jgi:hypothetical protein
MPAGTHLRPCDHETCAEYCLAGVAAVQYCLAAVATSRNNSLLFV